MRTSLALGVALALFVPSHAPSAQVAGATQQVRPGMPAKVFTDSAPGKPYDGWVGYVSPVAEFTPKTVETREIRSSLVYRLRVYVKNPDGGLRQGMPVVVRLEPEAAGGPAAAAPRVN